MTQSDKLSRRSLLLAAAPRRPAILLRSGWQTVNIGDIAHTPGLLRLLEKHVPEADVMLWSTQLDRGVDKMLERGFPRLRFTQTMQVDADLLLHGSGPSLVAAPDVRRWKDQTGNPYGACGITVAALTPDLTELLNGARFVFTRETASLQILRDAGIKGPVLDFMPDATFSFDLRDDIAADAFLRSAGLSEGGFLAVVPRLRLTPYHKIRKVDWPPAEIQRREQVNEKWAETDHAKLRTVIEAWVRKAGRHVLLCPEMTYEIDILRPLLYDPLPADIKPKVALRETFWLPDEAASVYRKAAVVVSMECHSPIIAAAQGTPPIYVHQPEDGIKGQMWKDVGLASNYFEVDKVSGDDLAHRVLDIAAHPKQERRRVQQAVEKTRALEAAAMKVVRQVLLLVLAAALLPAQTVTKIWDQAPHNAFTDLVRYKGTWFCVFREGAAHVSPDGSIRVLASRDGRAWTSQASISLPDADLRDPKIVVTPAGQLMLTAAGAMHAPPPRHRTYTWFSRNGTDWGQPAEIGEPDFWLWRVTWFRNTAYGVAYPTAGGEAVRLYQSPDGRRFTPLVPELFSDGYPNESGMVFEPDGTAVVLLRRDRGSKSAQLGRSKPPYTQWAWKDLGVQLGGPNLIRLPDGRLIAAGRLYDGRQRTAVCEVGETLKELIALPSSGDSSYPGLVWRKGELWMTYYSSHEGKTSIYFTRTKI